MTFRNNFKAVQREIVTALGEPATFTPAGVGQPVATIAVLEHRTNTLPIDLNFNADATETIAAISLLVEDVGEPNMGDTVLLGGVTWTVQRLLENNGIVVKVVVDD